MMSPFNAASWVEQFTNAGGGFVSNGQSVHFCWTFEGRPIVDNVDALSLYHEMKADPDKLAAVRQLICRPSPMEAQS